MSTFMNLSLGMPVHAFRDHEIEGKNLASAPFLVVRYSDPSDVLA